jgi:sporulation protein YlmC with PRC-barrel domain
MAHYGTLGDLLYSETIAEEIRGAKLYGLNDEKLGEIVDVIFDHSTGSVRYTVVDAGGWLSSKKFIVPADQIGASEKHDGDFEAPLTKQQIKSLPPYNEKDLESEEQWKDYERRYWPADENPVLHRKGSDRIIIPEPTEVPAPSGSAYVGTRQPILEPEPDRGISPVEDEIPISASGISGRWSTFEERLRKRRKEAISHCMICAHSSKSETASDRERDELPKAS